MLRASSGAADPLMLTITDGRGSYQGKIAAGPAGSGLILYRLQKPCATITADAPGPKGWKGKVAREVREGSSIYFNHVGIMLESCSIPFLRKGFWLCGFLRWDSC